MKTTNPTMTLLPAAPGTCPQCAVKHPPELPHNNQSLFYQVRFNLAHGRGATWADAIAHCDDRMKAFWTEELKKGNHWTEPPAGTPTISEPGGVQS